ncbi:DMT family transporter [Sphingomonas sp. CROZ-RG-20F-R02-07]|uniref:DMT family transporter n=1 Tax=Sphingomonas sp. CROZ-RG-20F-R02-07 TaxID=2914832 RepID=UPI001F5A7822|nr:DMT family transporter [Sphingomonas sp. CROZ-RG-20F-R02-07]
MAAAVGIAIYSGMDSIMKGLSIQSGAYSAVLWRSVAGTAIAGSVFVARQRPWPAGLALRLHGARGLASGLSVLFFFWGLARVPMAQSVALTFLAPLIALYLAAALLGETVPRSAVAGSLVATLGVLAIAGGAVQARASTGSVLGMIAIVVASILYAYSLILLRRQAQLADPLEVTLFTSVATTALLLLGSAWFAAMPAWPQTPAILAAAFLGTISSLLMAWAYARGETQRLAPIEYSAFLWAAVLGWRVFGERVSPWTMAGAVLIVAGCAIAVRRPIPAAQTEASA